MRNDYFGFGALISGAASLICFYSFLYVAVDRFGESSDLAGMLFLLAGALGLAALYFGVRSFIRPAGRRSKWLGIAGIALGALPWFHILITRLI